MMVNFKKVQLSKILILCLFSVSFISEAKDIAKINTSKEPELKTLTEMEQQQKILEQFKPLIKPREYSDLIVYSDKAVLPLTLNRLPELSESILPGRAPNIKLIPYLRKSFAHPAYAARFKNINYLLAVNCEDPSGFDDCSTTPHNRFSGKEVYVKFLQSSDPDFNLVKNMRVGQSYAQVKYFFPNNSDIHGGGECLKTSTEWLACFDANQLAVNKSRLQMMPSDNAKLIRFLKIKGKAY